MHTRKSSIIAIGIALSICFAGTGCQLQPGGKWYNPTAWKFKHKKDAYESSYANEEDNVTSPRSGTAPEIHSLPGGYSSNPTMVANNPQGSSVNGTYIGDRRYDYQNNQGGGPAPSPNVPVTYHNQNQDPRYPQNTNNDPRTGQYYNNNVPNNQGLGQNQNNNQQRDSYFTESYGQYSGNATPGANTQYNGYDQPASNNNNGSYNNGYNNSQANGYNNSQTNGYVPGSTDPSYNYHNNNEYLYR